MERVTILHLEDQGFMRSLVRAICENLNFHYVGVASHEKAGEVLAEGNIQYILSDISIADDENAGIAFVDKLREDPRFHGVPVVMLTKFGEEQAFRSAIEVGADDYLLKPVPANRLRQGLERWSRVVEAQVAWTALDRRQAKLLRLTLGTLGHAFDVAARGGDPPLELVRDNCFDLLQAAADDQLMGVLGTLRQEFARTFAHSLRMAAYLAFYAHSMNCGRDRMREMATAGLLHDIGVSRMDPEFIDKAVWTAKETKWFEATHISHNLEIVPKLAKHQPPETSTILFAVCCHHHERLDGSGPLALQGEGLSTEARMAAIIDLFLNLRIPRGVVGFAPGKAAVCDRIAQTPGLDGALVADFIASIGPE
ncbi:MAG: response regulator [Azospirillum sp.]|nr:response regulator [Azospirillum sp.]